MIPPPELDELERLDREATAGPWEAVMECIGVGSGFKSLEAQIITPRSSWGFGTHEYVTQLTKHASAAMASSIRSYELRPVIEAGAAVPISPDAALIVAMRNALPDLIHAARRAIELEEERCDLIQEVRSLRFTMHEQVRRCEDWGKSHKEMDHALECSDKVLRKHEGDPNA